MVNQAWSNKLRGNTDRKSGLRTQDGNLGGGFDCRCRLSFHYKDILSRRDPNSFDAGKPCFKRLSATHYYFYRKAIRHPLSTTGEYAILAYSPRLSSTFNQSPQGSIFVCELSPQPTASLDRLSNCVLFRFSAANLFHSVSCHLRRDSV